MELSLLELVKTRASQINGCGYCLDMHTKDARAQGETEQRLYTLPTWREAPFFTDRERAASYPVLIAWEISATSAQSPILITSTPLSLGASVS